MENSSSSGLPTGGQDLTFSSEWWSAWLLDSFFRLWSFFLVHDITFQLKEKQFLVFSFVPVAEAKNTMLNPPFNCFSQNLFFAGLCELWGDFLNVCEGLASGFANTCHLQMRFCVSSGAFANTRKPSAKFTGCVWNVFFVCVVTPFFPKEPTPLTGGIFDNWMDIWHIRTVFHQREFYFLVTVIDTLNCNKQSSNNRGLFLCHTPWGHFWSGRHLKSDLELSEQQSSIFCKFLLRPNQQKNICTKTSFGWLSIAFCLQDLRGHLERACLSALSSLVTHHYTLWVMNKAEWNKKNSLNVSYFLRPHPCFYTARFSSCFCRKKSAG